MWLADVNLGPHLGVQTNVALITHRVGGPVCMLLGQVLEIFHVSLKDMEAIRNKKKKSTTSASASSSSSLLYKDTSPHILNMMASKRLSPYINTSSNPLTTPPFTMEIQVHTLAKVIKGMGYSSNVIDSLKALSKSPPGLQPLPPTPPHHQQHPPGVRQPPPGGTAGTGGTAATVGAGAPPGGRKATGGPAAYSCPLHLFYPSIPLSTPPNLEA